MRYQSLLKLQGEDESLADQLLGKNISSTAVLAQKSVEDLVVIRSINEEFAEGLIEQAKLIPFVEKEKPQNDVVETSEPGAESQVAGADSEIDVPAGTVSEEEIKQTDSVDNPEE